MYFLPLFKTFFLGSQSVLTYATSHGLICGWDLRSSKLAWKLENDPSHGNVNVINFFFNAHVVNTVLLVVTNVAFTKIPEILLATP